MNIANSVRKLFGKPVSRKFEYNWILERVEDGSTVLDVGCVRGIQLQRLTVALLNKNCLVRGVSLNNVARNVHHHNFTYTKADVLRTRFNQESFDVIVASHVLQHLGLPYFGLHENLVEHGDEIFIEKAWKWLKPDGILFIIVPIAKKSQYVFTSNCTYRVYSPAKLEVLFAKKFSVVGGVAFDGAHDTKKKVKEAKALLWELKKIE